MAYGIVANFNFDEGVGGIRSEETPGGCWFHYSQWPDEEVEIGTSVRFEWRKVAQDGYLYACIGDIETVRSE